MHTAVNSHWHYDHIWGNQAFDATTQIVSSMETRRMIIATKGYGSFDEFMANAEPSLAATRAGLQATTEASKRRQLIL